MSEPSATDRIVTVGVDGSAGSAAALRWALDHADQLGTIVPVLAFTTGPFEYGFRPNEGVGEIGQPYRAEAILRLRNFLLDQAPSLVETGGVIESRPGPGLVHTAEGSELLVVGTRGSSARRGSSLGSIGAYCARHSSVPVALIPPGIRPVRDHLDVVVGFDGSLHSRSALRWTLTHLRRSARVIVVLAYEWVVGEPLSLSPDGAEARARETLDTDVAAVCSGLVGHPPLELRPAHGDPRSVLREQSETADLLVVGSRGHGVLDRLLLGSVANALVDHPMTPTIVVPGEARPSPGLAV